KVDDGVGGPMLAGIELFRSGAFDPAHVAGVFDNRHLQSQTDTKERDAVFANVAQGLDFAFDSAGAKTGSDDNPIKFGNRFFGGEDGRSPADGFKEVAFDPLDVDAAIVGDS